jgi:hypothetical protein
MALDKATRWRDFTWPIEMAVGAVARRLTGDDGSDVSDWPGGNRDRFFNTRQCAYRTAPLITANLSTTAGDRVSDRWAPCVSQNPF